MKNRTVSLLMLLFLVFGIYAVTRSKLNLSADKRGYDAIDYVILHGNVQHDHPVSPVRPTPGERGRCSTEAIYAQ